MSAQEPGRVDRASLERILQRAAELQAGEHDIGEGLTPDEVLALGKEVGIPSVYLRQAMLEDRSRGHLAEARGALDRLVGPVEISAVRVVQADEDGVVRALLWWMEKHELLAVQRQQPGRITWERLKGMPAYLRRGLSTFESGRAKFMLARADLVAATVTALEPGYSQVTLTATLRNVRSGILGGAGAMAAMGVAGTAVLVALNAWWIAALAPLPVAAVVAWGIVRGYRPVAERVQLGLERVLDHAEGAGVRPSHQLPARPPGLFGFLTRSVGWLLLALGCQATTTRPPFAPLPEAAVTRLHLPIGRATRTLADSLGADSVPIRRVEERDGYFESRWYAVPGFTVGGGLPLGPGTVRVRGWVDVGPVSGADTVSIITVEAAYRALEDPSRDDRELERHVEESHAAWQRIQAVLKTLTKSFGDPEEPGADSAAARPPVRPPARP